MEMTGFREPTEVGHCSFATRHFGIEAVTRSKVAKWKANIQIIQERLCCMQDNESRL
jgi:hypothetical protein